MLVCFKPTSGEWMLNIDDDDDDDLNSRISFFGVMEGQYYYFFFSGGYKILVNKILANIQTKQPHILFVVLLVLFCFLKCKCYR